VRGREERRGGSALYLPPARPLLCSSVRLVCAAPTHIPATPPALPFPSLPAGARLLLEFLSCNVAMEGSLGVEAAASLLEGAGFLAPVRVLKRQDVRGAYAGFQPPGLKFLDEVVMLATKPPAGG
jgi:hypothetical protein